MGINNKTGFTMIELLLFLAVTAALAITLMGGMKVSMDIQRYRDSITTLRSYVQTQYNLSTNVVNTRQDNVRCDPITAVVTTSSGGGMLAKKGMSDCMVMGRIISGDDDVSEVLSANIIGVKKSVPPPAVDGKNPDELEFYNYASIDHPQSDPSLLDQDNYAINWGSRIVKRGSLDPMRFKMAIIRSPTTGMLRTFFADGESSSNMRLNDMIKPAYQLTSPKVLCIANTGISLRGYPTGSSMLGIRIGAYATNQAAISLPDGDENLCA